MNRLRALWVRLRGSLWFVPSLLLAASVSLALALIELQPLLPPDLAQTFPRLFGAGAEGARGMLTAIATSMATVAGVVFSVTIVALSLTASQYSPRVLRNFMSDRPTQVVLGAFVAVFGYCLVVLRTIRGQDEGAFVPSLAVLGGVLMAFVGVGLLIYFIHHVASAIQVTYIVARIAGDTAASIDRLFPQQVGEDAAQHDEAAPLPQQLPAAWRDLPAPASGYLVGIDGERLLEWAARHGAVLRVLPRVGDFVVCGQPLLQIGLPVPGGLDADELLGALSLDNERNVDQDAPFGLQQLVDVALKALSPSMHDPTTATLCIDHLGALLLRLAGRRIESRWRERDGALRLVVEGPRFAEMLELALASITHHAAGHVVVHERLLGVLASLQESTRDVARRAALVQRLDAHLDRLPRCDLPTADAARLAQRIADLRRATTAAPRRPA